MNIHLIGVGGTAMGNLAAMLKEAGHQVTGSDAALYPPMSDRLREWGIAARPFAPDNLDGCDLAIIGNVISRGNAEAEYVLNERIPYMSMPEALHHFFLRDKDVIVAAGTHGKTTTAFLMDHVLCEAAEPPGLFVGGLRADGQNGYRLSNSRYFVIEGDEYDSAFFDKGAKFLHYRPRYLILTSVEYDHADIYPSKALYRQSFERLLRMIPSKGLVAACISDAGVRIIIKKNNYARLAPYLGSAQKAALPHPERHGKKDLARLTKYKEEFGSLPKMFASKGRRVRFSGYGGEVAPFSMIGEHNMANAGGVLLVAEAQGLDEERVRSALRSFPGVLRRQQIRLEKQCHPEGGPKTHCIFVEDFAHHPTAVAKTIQAVASAWPDFRIHALYEPRSATSHRNVFQKEYVEAFLGADFVYITDIYNKKKVAKDKQLDVRRLLQEIEALRAKNRSNRKRKENYKKNKEPRSLSKKKKSGQGKTAFFAKTPEALLKKLEKNLLKTIRKNTNHGSKKKGDIILAMSNGSFGGIYPEIEQWLESLPSESK